MEEEKTGHKKPQERRQEHRWLVERYPTFGTYRSITLEILRVGRYPGAPVRGWFEAARTCGIKNPAV